MTNKKILDYICCPKCKGSLEQASNFLICKNCQKKYEIIKGVPVLVDFEDLDGHYRKQILHFEEESRTNPSYILEEWQKSYIKRLRDFIPFTKDCIVADIGTGTGYLAIELAKGGQVVLACDLNLKGLTRLKRISEGFNLAKNLFLFTCSAEALPIKTDLIDVFVSNAVLEHLPKEEEAIREIARVCKENACGFVTVPLKLRYVWPFLWPINAIHDRKIGHLRRYNQEDLERKFGRYGFKIERTFYTGHLVKVFGILLERLFKTHRFDTWLEDVDRGKIHLRSGASNIGVSLKRGLV